MEEIKKDWVECSLGELSIFELGGDWGKAPNFEDENFVKAYCIRGSEFRNWKEEKGSTASLRKLKKSSVEKRNLQINDILVEISGGGPEQPVGRTEIIDKSVLINFRESNVVCTNFLRILRPSELTCAYFLNFYLKYFYSTGKIIRYQAGSNNLRNLKFKDYLTVKIPLPPLVEQKAIVKKIEELFSSLDSGIAYLKKAQEQLKTYRQAVLKKAFEGEFDIYNLGNISEIKRGKSKHRPRNDKSLFGGKYPFIQTGEIRASNGGVIRKYTTTYSEKGLAQSKLWPKGTLCLTIAANIGETAFLGFDACFPDSVVGINPNKELLNSKYLNFYIQKIKKEIDSKASATAQKNINLKVLNALEIPLPTIQEQKQIVQEIESRLSVCEAVEQNITESLEKAQALRQSILKKAFNGTLLSEEEIAQCKNHKDYEPASVLLEKIKAEKKKSNNKKK